MQYLRNAWYCAALAGEIADNLCRAFCWKKRSSCSALLRVNCRTGGSLSAPFCAAIPRPSVRRSDRMRIPWPAVRRGRRLHGQSARRQIDPAQFRDQGLSRRRTRRFCLVLAWRSGPCRRDQNSRFSSDERRGALHPIFGHLHTKANYELVIDNLLDLSHVEFLHPLVQQPEGVDAHQTEFRQEGNQIIAMRWKPNSAIHGLAGNLYWTSKSKRGDARAHMYWEAPSTLHFDLGLTEVGAPEEDGVCLPNAHLVTPQDEFTSHYFWSIARNRQVGDQAASDKLFAIANRVFSEEDLPMIEAQQENMGNRSDLMAMNPVALEPDLPATRARRILRQLIQAEQAENAPGASRAAE